LSTAAGLQAEIAQQRETGVVGNGGTRFSSQYFLFYIFHSFDISAEFSCILEWKIIISAISSEVFTALLAASVSTSVRSLRIAPVSGTVLRLLLLPVLLLMYFPPTGK
jgi:hypothetical protein